MLSEEVRREFLKARVEFLEENLFTSSKLEVLRTKIDEVSKDYSYCDGCGFCCVYSVPILKLEYERINMYIKKNPKAFTPQALVCPFLDFDPGKFQANISNYGKMDKPNKNSFPCRIYDERPIICRVFPSRDCRKFNSFSSPNFLSISQNDRELQILLNSYFYTIWWESVNYSKDKVDFKSPIMLNPGWLIDSQKSRIHLVKEPHWIYRFCRYWWHPHRIFELDPWEIEVTSSLVQSNTYERIIEKHSLNVEIKDIADLLTNLEFSMVSLPVNLSLIGTMKFEKDFWFWQSLACD